MSYTEFVTTFTLPLIMLIVLLYDMLVLETIVFLCFCPWDAFDWPSSKARLQAPGSRHQELEVQAPDDYDLLFRFYLGWYFCSLELP